MTNIDTFQLFQRRQGNNVYISQMTCVATNLSVRTCKNGFRVCKYLEADISLWLLIYCLVPNKLIKYHLLISILLDYFILRSMKEDFWLDL